GRMKNPFSKGNPCLNCFSTLCGPLPPSFLNLRTVIPIEDNSHRRTSPTYTADDDEYVRRKSPLNKCSNQLPLIFLLTF
ncbi:MAG: hypothetical protein LCH30_11180, partial [Proteobacteria bacterium]|nr:hypothetical protein [Pseudomonadota bacterium]